LQRSYNKAKQPSLFIFTIIEECSQEDLFDRELHWINTLRPVYNIGDVCGGDNYSNHPDKQVIREKLITSLRKGDSSPAKKKFKSSNPNWRGGKTYFKCPSCGKEYRVGVMVTSCIKCKDVSGEKNPFYRKKHSEISKHKIRQAKLGKKPSNAKKIKINDTVYNSFADAAKALNVCVSTITYRVKHGMYTTIIDSER
jgi:group I intron endonuclease